MLAYRESGLQPILIYHVDDPDDPDDVREQAARLSELPEGVQVVKDWAEARAVLWEGKECPPRRMKEELLQHRSASFKTRQF